MLNGWVAAKLVDGPAHCGSRGLMAGGEECHELVDEVFVGEGAGSDGNGEDVTLGWKTTNVTSRKLGSLPTDHLTAYRFDGCRRFRNFAGVLDTVDQRVRTVDAQSVHFG